MDELVAVLKDPEIRRQFTLLPPERQAAFAWRAQWLVKAHKHQIIPEGDWSIWLLLAGRGAGKTRTAAEQIGYWAWEKPATRWLVAAPTSADVRATCFEGDSGLIAVIPPVLVADYNRAYHEIKLTNGSLIKGIPASEPERFRGGQWHGAWCCIAGTQILMPDGQKAIEDIRVGEMVQTRHGPRKVLASGISGNPNELVSIELGATKLTLTADHPILIGDRWVAAGEVKIGDQAWVTARSAGDTPIASSTSGTLGLSRLDGWFTTRTKTRATTILQTLRHCLAVSTIACTLLAGRTLRLKRLPLPRLLSPFERPSLQPAFNAGADSSACQPTSHHPSAHRPAVRSGGQTPSSLSSGSVWSALARIWRSSGFSGTAVSDATPSQLSAPTVKAATVTSVERLPNTTTYNLTVEGEHEFIANGVVVHNCDELAAWDYLQDAWDQIMFSVRLGTQTRILATTTPKPKDLIIDLIGRDGDDVVVTTASTYDNLENLAPSFQKQILQYEGTKLGRQEIYAEIIDPEEGGIVNRDWFRLWPADKPIPKLEFVVQSYDCAFTEKAVNDPTAAITFGVFRPEDGPMSVLIIDCWQDRLQYPDLRPKVIEEYETVFGEGRDRKRVDLVLVEDKAAGISLIQDLQRAHVPVRAYNPGRADKVQRLSIVANIIKAGRVWVPESMNRKGYVRDWAEGMVSQICSFPNTDHDDFCLAEGSLVSMADGSLMPIEQVQVGQMVLTPAGPKPVLAKHNNGIKEVWRLEANGQTLLATGNHEVFTQHGWARVDCLIQAVHNVCALQEGVCHSERNWVSWLRRLSSTATNIDATLRARIRRIGGTLAGRDTDSIEMSGSSIAARFLTGCTSITLTATRPTTTSATWSASQNQSIMSIMPRRREAKSRSLILSPYETRLPSGIDQKRVGLGTESTPRKVLAKLGGRLASSRNSAFSAIGAAIKWAAKFPERSSADQPVRRPSQSFVSVKAATNTRTMLPVYDLTVADEHCYFANGILVHNCDALSQALRYLRDAGFLNIDPPPDEIDEEDYIDAGVRKRENPYAV